MKKIENICNEYEKKRKKHYFSSWLNWPALIERILYFPKKKQPNYEKTRKCDFIFDQNFLSWIEEENKPETYELDNWILYLKNHCSRISNRISFLLVYVAMTGAIASIFKITNMNKIALFILSIGLLGTIIERSMLIDKKATTEELVSLLEYKKSTNANNAN